MEAIRIYVDIIVLNGSGERMQYVDTPSLRWRLVDSFSFVLGTALESISSNDQVLTFGVADESENPMLS